jgi:hypothetical protein
MAEVLETTRRRLAAWSVTLLLVAACSEEPVPTAAIAVAGGGSGGKPPVELVCPARVPVNATACNATLFCEYPVQVCPNETASTTASCVNGAWLTKQAATLICEPPYLPMPLPCPPSPPVSGTACPSGPLTTNSCAFPTPECTTAAAYCFGSTWMWVGCEAGGAGGEGAGGEPSGGQASSIGGAAGSPD